MQENSRFFFRLAKMKARMRAPIGPFTNEKGELIKEEPCETLNKTYFEVFNPPEEGDSLPEGYLDSEEDLPAEEDRRLQNIYFSIKDIKKAIKETRSEAPGPSGISPMLAKKTCETIAPVLYQLFRKILKERKIPDINLISLISPLLKPGKDASKPSSYRPVALTELWIRILEKILKTELQWHAERLGLLSEDQHGFRRKKSTGSNLLEHTNE